MSDTASGIHVLWIGRTAVTAKRQRSTPMATEARETAAFIGSDKVEGTTVYDAQGEKMGSIERVMINKRSGQVAYAVLSFGGFLGIGNDSYPIPWPTLSYDTSLGGYRTTITEQQLQQFPLIAL